MAGRVTSKNDFSIQAVKGGGEVLSLKTPKTLRDATEFLMRVMGEMAPSLQGFGESVWPFWGKGLWLEISGQEGGGKPHIPQAKILYC